MSIEKQLIIYTDGAARGNPGPGGFGAVLMWGGKMKELSAGYRLTTNNRMELMAVIAALKALTKENINITIYTDSQYVLNSVEKKWLDTWVRTDFKGGKKNKDLWMQYYHLAKKFTIKAVAPFSSASSARSMIRSGVVVICAAYNTFWPVSSSACLRAADTFFTLIPNGQ